ncbi:MAG: methionyl-tRNA formyltransferase [Pseudomonadota bacterium]|jgi:methionyl-tRNA formyltransferase
MQALRIVFAGTPAFAASHLQAILASDHQVIAVYTQPDRPAGRGKQLQSSPVKALALSHHLPVLQPLSLKDPEAQARLASLQPDLMVVVAYGLILPAAVLAIPRFGCINVHASLLPRWRGAAPIERCLLAGDAETGVTIMQMDPGLDTGAMLHKAAVAISPDDNRLSLEHKLAEVGTQALRYTLDNLDSLQAKAVPQDDRLSTYASKLDKAEALVDWTLPAAFIERQVRAGIGRHPAYSGLLGERVRLLRARAVVTSDTQPPGTILSAADGTLLVACGEGALAVSEVQLPGKNPVRIDDLLNARAARFTVGHRFETPDLPS